MRCRDAERLLVMEEVTDYGAPRRAGLSRHLRKCPRCREAAAGLTAQIETLRAVFDALPIRPDFAQGVRARIDRVKGGQIPMP